MRAILACDIGNKNVYEWPAPIAKFLMGRLPAGELEIAAKSGDTTKKSNGKRMAAYFIGMDAIRRGEKQPVARVERNFGASLICESDIEHRHLTLDGGL
jgi:hypothetical protein